MSQHFFIVAWDSNGSAAARASSHKAHLDHIAATLDNFAIAGPLKNESGDDTGSMFVVKADSAADAEAIFRSDPYFTAGVWSRWEVHGFKPAAGEWIGGKVW